MEGKVTCSIRYDAWVYFPMKKGKVEEKEEEEEEEEKEEDHHLRLVFPFSSYRGAKQFML